MSLVKESIDIYLMVMLAYINLGLTNKKYFTLIKFFKQKVLSMLPKIKRINI